MILSTTDILGNRSILETYGVVSSQAYFAHSTYRSGAEPQPQLLANGYASFEVAMTAARQKVMADLIAKCEETKANAVIGISFSCLYLDGGIILICGSGTAVELA